MPPRHPSIARALGVVRRQVSSIGALRDEHGWIRVLVACSGGPDSMALLGLLELLARGERLRLGVAHVDHGLRSESPDEAAMVTDVCGARGLPVHMARLSLEHGPGLPARARKARRQALMAHAREWGASAIALGHTATDQAETVLLHLARGAGLDGLAAMPAYDPWPDPQRRGAWVRPLLRLTRIETRELAQRLELPFVDDPTNEDPDAPRVAVRQAVLPVLRGINPAAELALSAVADRAREADDALQAWIDRELAHRVLHDELARRRWSVEGASALPGAVRRGLVRAVCLRAGVPADALGRAVMDAIDAALQNPGAPHGWDLHGGRRLRLVRQTLWVEAGGLADEKVEDGADVLNRSGFDARSPSEEPSADAPNH